MGTNYEFMQKEKKNYHDFMLCTNIIIFFPRALKYTKKKEQNKMKYGNKNMFNRVATG